ncbi:MAG: outer membrane protein assembly factor BamC [Gammaproteobacteria bacterium]
MRNFIVLLVMIGLAGCSSTSDRKAVYGNTAETQQSLEVPPDLVEPSSNTALEIPAIVSSKSTFSSFSGSQQSSNGEVLASVSGDARIVRDGSMQWLEFKASADDLWTQVIAFFRNEGFEIKVSDTRLGIIETGWQENRVNVPTGWLSSFLSKLYDSGLRDKYRIRFEKGDKGIIRIFISHQGLVEKGADAADINSTEIEDTYWEVREPDPELEAEMMQRFLVFRGLDATEAKAMVARKTVQERAVLKEEAENSYLVVSENFPRSWRRTGLALDRLGLLVEDRNRSAGMYYIKITEEYLKAHEQDKGWFESLFSSSKKGIVGSYIIKLADQGESTQISLLDSEGKNITNQASKQLLGQLQRYLR